MREEHLGFFALKDSWSGEEIRAEQENRLQWMLNHARETVPFYRKMWDDIYEGSFQKHHLNLEDWPILEKQQLRQNSTSFISDQFKPKNLFKIQTSGTSGTPIKHYFDKESLSYWYSLYEHRTRRWNDLRTDEKWANIGGQLVTSISRKDPPFWVWNSPMKQLYLSSYHINEANAGSYFNALKKYKVRYIVGYSSSLYNLAFAAKKLDLEVPKMRLIVTNAEPLYDYQRDIIKEMFGCNVIQTYGGSEAAFAGNEDLTGTMYLWPEAGIIEVMDEKGRIHRNTSQEGDFIVTGLVNHAMPLIRYRVGDSGSIKINNGQYDRPFDIIENILGRTDDLIMALDGRKIGRLDPVFKSDLCIKEAQIIQQTLTSITVKVVSDNGYGPRDEKQIVKALKKRVGEEMNIEIQVVDNIPRTKNGKFKAVVSKVKN